MSYNTMMAVETAIRPSPQELERRYRNYVEDMQPYYRWFGCDLNRGYEPLQSDRLKGTLGLGL